MSLTTLLMMIRIWLLFKKYKALSKKEPKVLFGGRLAEYKYYDMHQVIASAFHLVSKVEEI
ncbi:UDP-galactopyranose mutase [Budvicia aquatica]|uniref:UDP-galactopyranose mutase n=1 Tax=Budvicia aquatica TaxID=82979 RepID=A0A484ZWN3_9GAMM|nr:UDP-galactopyranose mutase [Budvicia aquatica]